MRLYKMNKTSTGSPFILLGHGSKVLLNRGKPKSSSASSHLKTAFSDNSDSSGSSLQAVPSGSSTLSDKLSRLSIKGLPTGGDLKRRKYISL